MLDSIWIAILFVAVVFQLVAIYEKSVIFSIFTTMFWLVLMINALVIEWPYYSQVYNVSAGNITTSEGVIYFSEVGLSYLFLGFIFINIIWSIVQFMNFQERSRLP